YPDEIAGQIMISRMVPSAAGHVHFPMRALMQNRKGICDLLREGVYSTASLVPASTWLQSEPPPAPTDVAYARLQPEEVWAATNPKRLIAAATEPPTTNPATTRHVYPLATQPAKEIEKLQKLGGYRITWMPA